MKRLFTKQLALSCVLLALPLSAMLWSGSGHTVAQEAPGKKVALPEKTSFAGTKAGQEWSANGLKLKFCWCPSGKFTMGSPAGEKDHRSDEDRVPVTLTRGFWLGKYEVTQGEWKELIGSEPWSGKASVKEGRDYAASYLSWEDATKFCEGLTKKERSAGRLPQSWSYTLPTEAQWEYACRAGRRTWFGFGDEEADLGKYAWYDKNAGDVGERYAHQVGQKRANDWGLHDMHGNAWEWCRDWYKDTLPGGTDPEVTDRASLRVDRGGSWGGGARYCRSAYRDGHAPVHRFTALGFRVALVQQAEPGERRDSK